MPEQLWVSSRPGHISFRERIGESANSKDNWHCIAWLMQPIPDSNCSMTAKYTWTFAPEPALPGDVNKQWFADWAEPRLPDVAECVERWGLYILMPFREAEELATKQLREQLPYAIVR